MIMLDIEDLAHVTGGAQPGWACVRGKRHRDLWIPRSDLAGEILFGTKRDCESWSRKNLKGVAF